MAVEYKFVPAPQKGLRSKGLRSAEDRFAHALEKAVNELAADGWEYIRCDTLPSEERSGLTQTQTVWRNLLVFRREAVEEEPVLRIAPPVPEAKGRPALRAVENLQAIGPADIEDQALREALRTDLTETPADLPGPLRARARRLRHASDGLAG